MIKPVVEMRNWELYVYDGVYYLSGTADYHHGLGKYAYVGHTSSIKRCEMDGDELMCETKNTIYICPLQYMSTHPYMNVVTEQKRKMAKLDEKSDGEIDRIIAAAAKLSLENCGEDIGEDEYLSFIKTQQKLGQEWLEEELRREREYLMTKAKKYENCIYLEVSRVGNCGDILAYNIDGRAGTIDPYLHGGMFQDSVLYTRHDPDTDQYIDFRYFPEGFLIDTMKTYSWSENIKRAIIKNTSSCEIIFNGVKLESGETKEFLRDESHNGGMM